MPREARLMLLSLFLDSLPIGLLLVLFPLYLHDLGMRSLLIGSIFTVAGIASSVLLVAIGPLADRFGRRRFLIAGTLLPALGFAIFFLSTDPHWLVVASVLGGVGFSGGLGGGLVTATFNPILAGTVEPRRRTTALSYGEVAWALAMGTGSLLAGTPALLAHAHLISQLSADRALFMVCLVLTIVATLLLLPVHERYGVKGPTAAQTTTRQATREAWPLIIKLSVFFTLQGAGLGLVVQLLPLWFALRFHTSVSAIAPWFAVSQVIGIPFILLVPAIARRLGVANVIVLVASLSTCFLIGVPLAASLQVAGILFIVRSALVSMQWPAQHSFLQGAVDPRVRGTATSITLGCWSTANALLPSLAGYLMDRHLLAWPLMLGTACYGTSVLWFALTLRGTAMPEEAPAGEAVAAERLAVSQAG